MELKNRYACFLQQPLYVRYILVLTVSVFMPFYISLPIIFTAFFYFMKHEHLLKTIADVPYIKLYAVQGILLLVTPLVHQNYLGFGCGILFIVYFMFEFYLNQVMTQKLCDQITNLIAVMSLICAIIAIWERLSGLQTRVMALTYNPNYYAYMIEIAVIVCLYQYIISKKPVYLWIILFNIPALFLTECRSAWIAMMIAVLVFLGILKKKKAILISILCVAGLFVLAYLSPWITLRYSSIDPSLMTRLDIWDAALLDFSHHPIFGRGLLGFLQYSGSMLTVHAHSLLFDLLECTGVVGTAIVGVFVWSMIRQLAAAFRLGDPQIKARVALCAAAITATFAHGITDIPVMGINTGLFCLLLFALRPNLTNETPVNRDIT